MARNCTHTCLSEQVLETHGEQFIFADVDIILLSDILLFDLVLKDSRSHPAAPNTLQIVIINGLLLFRRDLEGLRFDLLLIVGVLESPLDVAHRRVFNVLLDVVKSMLANVGDAQVVVDEQSAFRRIRGLCVADYHFHESRFTGTVGSNQTYA